MGRSRARGARTLVAIGAFVVLASACGQMGGVHQPTVAVQPVSVAGTAPGGVAGLADAGASRVDAGGAVGSSLSGDSTLGTSSNTSAPISSVTAQITLRPLVSQPRVTNPRGPLYVCPVQGRFSLGDDFGAPRYSGGYHPHAGNDIFAAENTPIVAPFPGTAFADPNTLGGNAVVVRGKDGYVYNAHLVAYGRLGDVHTGDVIGYVGNTGDAQGGATHDHFEWHPYHPTINWVSSYGYATVPSGDPPAVDPFPYLRPACS